MMLVQTKRILATLLLIAALLVPAAHVQAEDAETITLASVGWTGVTIKTEIAMAILESLGYEAEHVVLAVPIVYSSLSTGEADVFLGNWMPSMASIASKYFEEGTVEQLVANMPGAQYTLAVPTYCAEAGLQHFEDIASFGDELEWNIYGIEAGNDGNLIIQDMIDRDLYGLGAFTLVPSSEVGMLAQVQAFTTEDKCIVFLGWAPHSMNERIDMTYLKGSDETTFGADDGTATVWTNVRTGFVEDHPNLGTLFTNLDFPVSMMNQIMTTLHETEGLSTNDAGLQWLKEHPEQYAGWFEGVTTADGQPALPAFEAYLDKAL